MSDSLAVKFRRWLVERVRALTFPSETPASYDVAPGPYMLHAGLATVAGGEVARLRMEGHNDEAIRAALREGRSLDEACEALDIKPGTAECESLHDTYGLAVVTAIGILRKLYPTQRPRDQGD